MIEESVFLQFAKDNIQRSMSANGFYEGIAKIYSHVYHTFGEKAFADILERSKTSEDDWMEADFSETNLTGIEIFHGDFFALNFFKSNLASSNLKK